MKENRQGCLKVNWPQAKRDRPGPFTSNQTTFEHFFEVFKSPAACRKDFFDKLGRGGALRRPAAIAFQQGLKFRLVLEESQFGLPLELQQQAGQQNGPDGHLRTG